MKKLMSLFAGLLLFGPSAGAAAPILGNIKIDHFGYRRGDSKIAYFTASPGSFVGVYDSQTQTLAYRVPASAVTDMGMDASSPLISGDHVWQVDFSALTAVGSYYVYSSSLNEASYSFKISDTLYQAPIAAALKSFYYARCGAPKTATNGGHWNDAACHTADRACTAVCAASLAYPGLNANYGTLNLLGGWHDAGDYEKKIGPGTSCGVTETGDNGDALWYLLSAYDINPGLFNHLSVKLPETGNGLPDILNQAKWELDWYLRMQMTDFHVLEGVHVSNLGTLASPPSIDSTARGYNPPSFESEAIFTASVAHAARIFAMLPGEASYAATLKSAALNTWNKWVLNSPELDPYALSWFPYAPVKVWAASEIFRMDPTQNSAQKVIDQYHQWSVYGSSYAYSNYAIINYLQSPGATPAVVTVMKSALANLVNSLFAMNDLYNSAMPAYEYSWGSNQFKADTGLVFAWAARLGVTGSHTPAQCMAHAEDYLHYFHGDNPMNMVYLSNTDAIGAKHCMWQIYNSWFGRYQTAYSLTNFIGKPDSVVDPLYPYTAEDNEHSSYGPPPGYVTTGPTYQYFQLRGSDTPPNAAGHVAAPYAKSYRDYNRSFSTTSQPWIVNETGIYQTGAYLLLASFFVAGPGQVPTREGS